MKLVHCEITSFQLCEGTYFPFQGAKQASLLVFSAPHIFCDPSHVVSHKVTVLLFVLSKGRKQACSTIFFFEVLVDHFVCQMPLKLRDMFIQPLDLVH